MYMRPLALDRLARRGAFLVAIGLIGPAATSAWAAPDANPEALIDPVARLLAEKGLIEIPAPAKPPAADTLLRRARERASEMVLTALNFVGVHYRRGGSSQQSGFDCSGFTRFVFGTSLGLMLPRRADEQAAAPGLVEVPREDLQPGDLVFFDTLQRTFSHVGIYIGDKRFVHAPRPGSEVRIEDMGLAYWKNRFSGARRAEAALDTALPDPATPPAPQMLR